MRRLTSAVAVLVAMLAPAAACTLEDPSAASSYTVLVDLYSGRQNPEVELGASVGEQVYRELAGRTDDFSPGLEPAPVLGFRGFVVTPDDDSLPVLRITTDTVYATRADGVQVLADPRAGTTTWCSATWVPDSPPASATPCHERSGRNSSAQFVVAEPASTSAQLARNL